MRLRFCILMFGLFVLQLISTLGCNKCSDQKYFNVIDVFIENGRILDEEAMIVEDIETNEHVVINKFCMTLTTGLEYFSAQSGYSPYLSPFSFTSALASCPTLDPLPAHRITQLLIVSNADFIFTDEVFVLAGQPLNEHMAISFGTENRILLSNFLTSSNNHPMEVPIYMFINGLPAYNQLHRFTVKYTLDDGQSFSASTEKVIITPN